MSLANAFQNFGRPCRAFTAWRALTTRLVRHETAAIVQNVDHTRLVVNDDDSRCSQPQTSDFSRSFKVELRIELIGREEAHADAARDNCLRFAALPNAASMRVDQLAYGDSKRQLDA